MSAGLSPQVASDNFTNILSRSVYNLQNEGLRVFACLAVVLVHTDVMHRSAVFQRFLHPLPAVRMIYA